MSFCPAQCPTLKDVLDGVVYSVGKKYVEVQLSLFFFNPNLTVMTSSIKELFLSRDSNPSPLRVANRALDGCPTNPGFIFNKTAGLENNCRSACVSFHLPLVAHHKEVFGHIRIKLRTKAQREFCSHSASEKRCSSVQNQSLAEQDVTDQQGKIVDQIVSLKNQAGTTTSNVFPKDGAIPFTLNVTQAVDGQRNKTIFHIVGGILEPTQHPGLDKCCGQILRHWNLKTLDVKDVGPR
ncbi:unnamed protein product [Clavelina lepadiformis]|uniref:Uncharacterized protein n=1 Tax=Clavelina lepadiformis TaxID=159417 RepID=A0ABP0G515_CLALP